MCLKTENGLALFTALKKGCSLKSDFTTICSWKGLFQENFSISLPLPFDWSNLKPWSSHFPDE